jgi:hypothetical protein
MGGRQAVVMMRHGRPGAWHGYTLAVLATARKERHATTQGRLTVSDRKWSFAEYVAMRTAIGGEVAFLGELCA